MRARPSPRAASPSSGSSDRARSRSPTAPCSTAKAVPRSTRSSRNLASRRCWSPAPARPGMSAARPFLAGSVLNALTSLPVGGCNLVGTLTIADGGVVNSPNPTSIAAGSTLNLGTGGLAGAIVTPAIVNNGQIVANFTDTLTLAAAISGAGTLSKAGPGTLILTGSNTYTGATTINGGTLIVNGSIANSTVTVNAGGRLGGTGTLGNT